MFYRSAFSFLALRVMLLILLDTDDSREACSAERTMMVAPSTMPEVQQYAELMRQAYQDFLLTPMKSQSRKVQTLILRSQN
jgi:hypothetical protein